MDDISPSIDIQNTSGDVIGIGVSGDGNIIGKDINIVINEAQSYGLTLLSAIYFKEHKSTEQDLKDWRNGFSFKLEAIKEKRELRRSIVDKVKINLEREHRLLIVGESGTSKSTILMETICEYFDCGYKILYNFGETELRNSIDLVKFIEGLLKGNNKVLIAVDNVHSERTAAIFYIMDQLSNYELSKNLLFILTARLPEFDWLVNDRLNRVEEPYRQPIRKFSQLSQCRYEVEPFTEKDIEEFIKSYKEPAEIIALKEKVSDLGTKIYRNTNGHPIMVKFYVLGKGLKEDVEDRYYRYLTDVTTTLPDLTKIQTALVCSLLDIANLSITDKLLERMEIQDHAYDLEHALLYQYSEGSWKTIHPRWDIELLSFLYNEKNKSILLKRAGYLKKALNSIFSISDESITASIIQTMYDIASLRKIPIDIVESTTLMPQYLSSEIKFSLYLFTIASTYRILQMYPEMLENCNKALLSKPKDITAMNAKAVSLSLLEKYDEALECCDEIIRADPNDAAAYTSKGLALNGLKRYDEALECWKKAVEIDDNYIDILSKKIHSLRDSRGYGDANLIRILVIKLSGKGMSYAFIKKYDEALECSNKALELDPNSTDSLNNKSWALNALKKYDEALECSNKALELDPNGAWAYTNKAWALNGLKRHDEALECSNKALDLDQTQYSFSAWNNKAAALNGLKRYDEALECSNKALEINPKNEWAWLVRGLIFNGLKRYDEALECSNKSLELDPNNDLIFNNKSWALNALKKYDEALECSNKALELDPNGAWAYTNKALALSNLGKNEEALECSNKSLELDPNSIPNSYASQHQQS
jgi:tetratricopeptide (TPR) repeat protein